MKHQRTRVQRSRIAQDDQDIHTTHLGRLVIGCATEAHFAVGPGLLESMYERCLAHEFRLNGLSFRQQVALPISCEGLNLGGGYRVDFVVEDELLIELKTVERIIPVHDAQVMTYMRLLGLRQGFLINFKTRRVVDGIKSYLNSRVASATLPGAIQHEINHEAVKE